MVKRKAKKPAKSRTTRTTKPTKRKPATRRRKSGNLFQIDRVPTLI